MHLNWMNKKIGMENCFVHAIARQIYLLPFQHLTFNIGKWQPSLIGLILALPNIKWKYDNPWWVKLVQVNIMLLLYMSSLKSPSILCSSRCRPIKKQTKKILKYVVSYSEKSWSFKGKEGEQFSKVLWKENSSLLPRLFLMKKGVLPLFNSAFLQDLLY